MRIEYCPALSPLSGSRRLLGSPARSARLTAASSISNRFQPWRSKPWNARTNAPFAKSSVRLSLKLRIIEAQDHRATVYDPERCTLNEDIAWFLGPHSPIHL